jgi:hypothetical protein
MTDDEFRIEKVPIYGRDDGPSRLLGWTWGEMALLAGAVIATHAIAHRRLLTISAAVLTYLYIRRVKQLLPDRWFRNLCRFHLRKHAVYRAGARDTYWRPPIRPELDR